MGRQPLHSDTVKIEQKAPIINTEDYDGDIVIADKPFNKEWADEMAFQEDPVTIILNPSAEKNAPTTFPVWVNGKGAEVLQSGKWFEIKYLPIGQPLTIKRKYLEVIIRTKLDTVTTQHEDATVERPNNQIRRSTSSAHSFSILEDKNPKGRAWAQEMIRRNM